MFYTSMKLIIVGEPISVCRNRLIERKKNDNNIQIFLYIDRILCKNKDTNKSRFIVNNICKLDKNSLS